MHTKRVRDIALLMASLICLIGQDALAHPMGNFAICHDAHFTAERGVLHLRYILDFAEIPTVAERHTLDSSGDGTVSETEKAAYLAARTPVWKSNLLVTIDGKTALLEPVSGDLIMRPGAGNLPTMRVVTEWRIALPAGPAIRQVQYKDTNYPERTGWKEISAAAGQGTILRDSSVPTDDRSTELTTYPANAIPPQDAEANFGVETGEGNGATGGLLNPSAPTHGKSATPQDAFTQAIATARLTPAIILLGLGIAFIFGAFHALSPGHGKTMVAAYLVGSHGTPKHAALLGLTVTITHTAGVFALGFVTLFASQYILPERLYSVLSIVSGLAVFGVGVWLLATRSREASGHGHTHDHDHDHFHTHDEHDHSHVHTHDEHDHSHVHTHEGQEHSHVHTHEGQEHSHVHTHDGVHFHAHESDEPHDHDHDEHTHTHDHDHDSSHVHTHDEDEHAYAHAHGLPHTHSHGGKAHSHALPEGPITLKSLIALGISGGIVPCPSALVVLLSAIALHRLAFGMLLIVAFSAGLAAVLIAIGLMVVSASQWINRLPQSGVLMRRLPVASAAMITVIGAVLVVRAVTQGTP